MSEEVDEVLRVIATVTKDREDAVHRLEQELDELQGTQHDLTERITALQARPFPSPITSRRSWGAGERRSAGRDYPLFTSGVITSAAVAVIMRTLGWA